jgi:DNA-binding response OmpR family regulator
MEFAILLIGDESSDLSAGSDYFRNQGFQVTLARELAEAEALILRFEFSLVIVDLSVAVLNYGEGLRLIDLIRVSSPSSKIILLSGHLSSELRTEALRRGAQAVLTKPQPLVNLGVIAHQLRNLPEE